KPYSFSSISQVFDLHLSHLMQYLHRMRFTEDDYLRQQVPLNLSTFRRCALQIAFKWSIILLLTLTYKPNKFASLRGFNLTFERALNVQKIDFFIAIYQSTFVVCEYACLYSLFMQLRYQNTKLDVVYDLRSKLDKELNAQHRSELINYFVRYSYVAGLCNKFTALGVILFTTELLFVAIGHYSNGHIDLSQLMVALYLSISVQFMFFQVMFIIFTLLTGMFLIIKVFRMKM